MLKNDKKCQKFKNVTGRTDGRTDQPTDQGVESHERNLKIQTTEADSGSPMQWVIKLIEKKP